MKTDFLVIGSGAAGLSFALKAAAHGHVTIVTKGEIEECNTNYAQGGICSVTYAPDTFEKHIRDTLVCGAGKCDEKAVELALLAMDVEYEPVESSERGRSFRTVLQTECRGEDVLITVTNSHRAAKPVPPDEWQLPEEALSGLSEKGLRRLLGVD